MHEKQKDLEGNEKYFDGFILLCLPSTVSDLWQKPVNIWTILVLWVRFILWQSNFHQNVNVERPWLCQVLRFIILKSSPLHSLVTCKIISTSDVSLLPFQDCMRVWFRKYGVIFPSTAYGMYSKWIHHHRYNLIFFYMHISAFTALTVTAKHGLTFPIVSVQ